MSFRRFPGSFQEKRPFLGAQSLLTSQALKNSARTLDDGAESEDAIRNARASWDERMAGLTALSAALKDGATVLSSTAKKVVAQKRRADKMQERAEQRAQQRQESDAQTRKKARASGAAPDLEVQDFFDAPMDDLPNFKARRRIDCTKKNDENARDHSEPEIFVNMPSVEKQWHEVSTGPMATVVEEFRRRYPDAAQFKFKGAPLSPARCSSSWASPCSPCSTRRSSKGGRCC